jgi:hypothetical protein
MMRLILRPLTQLAAEGIERDGSDPCPSLDHTSVTKIVPREHTV